MDLDASIVTSAFGDETVSESWQSPSAIIR
jgi:hypothetical protein